MRAADGVVLEQERHRVRVAERVVHRHELDVRLLAPGEDGPRERPADAAEPVDPDSYGHPIPPGEPARGGFGLQQSGERRRQSGRIVPVPVRRTAIDAACGVTPSSCTAVSLTARPAAGSCSSVSTRPPWSRMIRR